MYWVIYDIDTGGIYDLVAERPWWTPPWTQRSRKTTSKAKPVELRVKRVRKDRQMGFVFVKEKPVEKDKPAAGEEVVEEKVKRYSWVECEGNGPGSYDIWNTEKLKFEDYRELICKTGEKEMESWEQKWIGHR